MSDLMIKVENVAKEYRLGVIGGTTLVESLQRLGAKIRHKPDPTVRIGEERTNDKGLFQALKDISFEAKKGEAVGIIGHNGAGKSTLLKLITQVTAPTSGEIYLNGRVASMLEVGTGFHPELTGRENIYLNGAILGMTKKEIDSKIDDIIEFSECKQFIDTPVKRYSSGMYVKLAFSVAAHLDSEIMIMDEVLAVGDVAFQNKCINKMKDVSKSGRTILYVSHNMSTIRSLCTRCICLDKGKVIYDGDVETAITHYTNARQTSKGFVNLDKLKRHGTPTNEIHLTGIDFLDFNGGLDTGKNLTCKLFWRAKEQLDNMRIRVHISSTDGQAVGASLSDEVSSNKGENQALITLPTDRLLPGKYEIAFIPLGLNKMGGETRYDCLVNPVCIEVLQDPNEVRYANWNGRGWGRIMLDKVIVSKE